MPLLTEVPRKTIWSGVGGRGPGGRGIGALLDRKGLARQSRFADQEVHGVQHEGVGGNHGSGGQQDAITDDDLVKRNGSDLAVPTHARAEGQSPLKGFDGVGRAVLLDEAHEGAAQDNGQNDPPL